MPTTTYSPLGTVRLSTTSSEVVFSNIPASTTEQNFKDLVVVTRMISNGGDGLVGVQFNGDTSNTYVNLLAYGEAPSTTGGSVSTRTYLLSSITSVETSNPTSSQFQVMDYTATNKHKTALIRINRHSGDTSMVAGRWPSSNAITSVRFYFTGTGQFAAGSTFNIYGIAG